MELAFDEAQDQTGLSHCWFAQQHQLKLADLVAHCRAVGPCRSASPSHSPVLKMWKESPGVMGEYWFEFGPGLRAGWRSGSGVQVRFGLMTERARTSPDGAVNQTFNLVYTPDWNHLLIPLSWGHLGNQARDSNSLQCPSCFCYTSTLKDYKLTVMLLLTISCVPLLKSTVSLYQCPHSFVTSGEFLQKSSSRPHFCSETTPPAPKGANTML